MVYHYSVAIFLEFHHREDCCSQTFATIEKDPLKKSVSFTVSSCSCVATTGAAGAVLLYSYNSRLFALCKER